MALSLRTKTLAIIVVVTGSLVALCVPLRAVMLDRFGQLELELGTRDLDRARNMLANQTEAMHAIAREYAVWDETYAFAIGQNGGYVEHNLSDTTLAQLRIGLVALVGSDGHEVYTKALDLHTGKVLGSPAHRALFPTDDDVLFAHRSSTAATPEGTRTVSGFVRIGSEVMLVGAFPIVTTARAGPPHGTLVFGRALDGPEVARLAAALRLDVSIVAPGVSSPEIASAVAALAATPTVVRPLNDDTLVAYARLDDLRGAPVGILRVAIPRTVYAQGRSDANTIALSVAGASLVFGLLLLALLQRLVIRRVTRLAGEIAAVATVADHSLRVTIDGDDEVATLATNTNSMLDALDKLTTLLDIEHAKAEKLLRNILPPAIAERLKDGETIADSFADVSVLFADIVGFTEMSSHIEPTELVVMLNEIFSRFDALAERHGLEKIKTIGDAYMVVAGVPEPRADHAAALAIMALDMQDALEDFNLARGTKLHIRIGINTGHVVAGVIGTKKFIYDLWGDSVNIASRMESSGVAGRVQITEATRSHLDGKVAVEERGVITVKGRGEMRTWLLLPRERSATA